MRPRAGGPALCGICTAAAVTAGVLVLLEHAQQLPRLLVLLCRSRSLSDKLPGQGPEGLLACVYGNVDMARF